MDARFWVFVSVAALLTITPGADTALVMRSTLSRGRLAALLTVAGICIGCLIHAVASALGLSVILSQSAAAFEAVKTGGALYLVWLGVQSLRGALRGSEKTGREACPTHTAMTSFSEGLLTNLLNPKVALFYLTFLPQFVSPEGNALRQSVLLAGIHIVMGFVWLSAFALFLDKLSGFLLRDRVKRRLEAATGVLMMGLGLRLALEKR